MAAIIAMIGGLPKAKERKDDDFIDRLNHRYTVSLLSIFSIVVTTSQYVGERIYCWLDAHFSGEWSDYAHDYCWVKNTYYLPFEDHIPKEHEEEKRAYLAYYQWVPLILLAQALLFTLPQALWRYMNSRAAVDISAVMRLCKKFQQSEESKNRDNLLNSATHQIHRFLMFREKKNTSCNFSLSYLFTRLLCPCVGRTKGNYLLFNYLFIKVLYIFNSIMQMWLLSFFFGKDFYLYGFEAISEWVKGSDVSVTNRFPRVTMCDFKVRFLGNVQRYTTQCVLPINLFHEKIYLIVWFWMVMIIVVNIWSLCSWIAQSAYAMDRHRFIKNHMRMAERKTFKRDNEEGRKRLIAFVDKHLCSDGVFLLRLLQVNTDLITISDIVSDLWDVYNHSRIDEDKPRGIDLLQHTYDKFHE